MKILLFTLLVIFLLVSCSPSKCSIYDTLSYIYIDKWEHKSIPQKGMLYISGRKSFIGQKDSIPVINIFTDELDSTYITCEIERNQLYYINDFYLVLDDSIVYDITDIRRETREDREHWGMFGPSVSCVVTSMKVNGTKIKDSEGIAFPAKLRKIIKKR